MSAERCATCGRAADAHDRHHRFLLPAPIYDLPERERTPGTWMSHGTPNESVMMQLDGMGAFIRVLMPVRLDGGHNVTYGVWLGVHPSQLQEAFAVWWEPAYTDLRLDGRLANTVEPWGLLGSPVIAAVRNLEETPYCSESTDPLMSSVLNEEWPHEQVLGGLS